MIVQELSCFRGFRCTASACQDNCCIGWEIDIDEQTLARYRQVSGPLGERLQKNIAVEADGTAHFLLGAGERCPFLRADNLCALYCELGESALSEICQQHPRFHHFYGDFLQETGFGLCCEEAGRLLFGAAEGPVICASQEDDSALEPLSPLLRLRDNCLQLLANDALPLWQRLGQLLTYAAAAQKRLDQEPFRLPPLMVPLPSAPEQEDARDCCRTLFALFGELESINSAWDEHRAAAEATFDLENQEALLAEFHQKSPRLEEDLRRFGVYLLFRYFLDDGLDGDVLTPAQLTVAFVAALHRLDFTLWLRQGRGAFTLAQQVEAAKLLSKELEYSVENMDVLREELIFPEMLNENAPILLIGEVSSGAGDALL